MDIPHPSNHPAGITAVVSALLLVVLRAVHVDISADVSLAIAAGLTGIVSLFFPRVVDIHVIDPKVIPLIQKDLGKILGGDAGEPA